MGSSQIFFCDKALFCLPGHINEHTRSILSRENLHEFRGNVRHPTKIGVWMPSAQTRIFSTKQHIPKDTATFGWNQPFIGDLHDNKLSDRYFQQHYGTAHEAFDPMKLLLQEYFGERILVFPAQPPDSTVLDHFRTINVQWLNSEALFKTFATYL